MTDPRDAAATRRDHERRDSGPVAPRWRAREDLGRRYPEPSANFRISMFGLSLEAYVGEVRRRQADGWAGWEISLRLPRPDQEAS